MIKNWLKRKMQLASVKAATDDIQRFLQILKGSSSVELGELICFSTLARVKLRNRGSLKDEVFDVAATILEQAPAQYMISQLIPSLQKNKQFSEAAGLMVWLHSLRAFTYLEIRSYGRDMWKELNRGFKQAEESLEIVTMTQPDYVPIMEINELFFIPLGLEPEIK